MGCDIHVLAEWYDEATSQWVASPREIDDSRYYWAFGLLAGVREHSVRPIALPRGVPEDCSMKYAELVKRWDDDGHSHSWVTLEELQAVVWSHCVTVERETDEEFPEALPLSHLVGSLHSDTMPYLVSLGKKSRLVFFFDN